MTIVQHITVNSGDAATTDISAFTFLVVGMIILLEFVETAMVIVPTVVVMTMLATEGDMVGFESVLIVVFLIILQIRVGIHMENQPGKSMMINRLLNSSDKSNPSYNTFFRRRDY